MSAYFLVMVNFDRGNADAMRLYDTYIEKVKPIVEAKGGEYLVRTENIVPLSAEFQPDRVIVIRFHDRQTLDSCFQSAEYRAIAAFRENSVQANALIVEGI